MNSTQSPDMSDPAIDVTLQEVGFAHAWKVGIDGDEIYVADHALRTSADARKVFSVILNNPGASLELAVIAEQLDEGGDRLERVGKALSKTIFPLLEARTEPGELVEQDGDVIWIAGLALVAEDESGGEAIEEIEAITTEKELSLEDLVLREPSKAMASQYKKADRIARKLLKELDADAPIEALTSTLLRLQGLVTPKSILRATYDVADVTDAQEEQLVADTAAQIAVIESMLPGHMARHQYKNRDGELKDFVAFHRILDAPQPRAVRTTVQAPTESSSARLRVEDEAGHVSDLEISDTEHRIVSAFIALDSQDYFRGTTELLFQIYNKQHLRQAGRVSLKANETERAIRAVNKRLGSKVVDMQQLVKVHKDGQENYMTVYRT